jgi:hypothetical protein
MECDLLCLGVASVSDAGNAGANGPLIIVTLHNVTQQVRALRSKCVADDES